MEFEAAARRLAKDQSKLRGRRGPPPVSAKARREAEYRKKQQEKIREEREKRKLQLQHAHHYMTSCDRQLGVASLVGSDDSLSLVPTSIHGEGDKLALPPSVLQHLTEKDGGAIMGGSSPWTFRIGIPRPGYTFPSSKELKEMRPPSGDDDMMDDDSDEENTSEATVPYLRELSHRFISYTHGTVVEFTQDEGHVGLPASIASALLDRNRRRADDGNVIIPVTRTSDPAAAAPEDETSLETRTEEEKTPGHPAYGAFDIPGMAVEIGLLKLPKGKACILKPTEAAVRNGFYGLKDVKLVLEQSLIRTRATLSVGDVVHTWHRGYKFDLVVSSVTPPDYRAVSCINTDIEVDFESNSDVGDIDDPMDTGGANEGDPPFGPGRVLSSAASASPVAESTSIQQPMNVLPEPPLDQKEGVCTVQVRCPNGSSGRHRFDVAVATIRDLFVFAGSVCAESNLSSFQLVTRFPRRVFALAENSSIQTLEEAGISAGQELFLLETI